MTLEELFRLPPYGLSAPDKERMLSEYLSALTLRHYEGCPEYRRILDVLGVRPGARMSCAELPFLPVRLFKQYELRSVPKQDIVKTLTSSGTSGQAVSRIFLNAANVRSQSRALNAIISSFIGRRRLPLLLLDTDMIRRDRSMYSARGAGIIGFSLFGRDVEYALDADMRLDEEKVARFFGRHEDEPVLMFGYTYMIWQFVIRTLEERGRSFSLKNAVLFHIGGWKKLRDQAVDAGEFNRRVRACLGEVRVHNYYGMAEQLGSVFVECEHGHMHCSNFSEVIIRRSSDFSEAGTGERGLVELLSVLPESYPGHVLLTEDEGEILGRDDCPCGRGGTYFRIHGRIRSAELRGCSDTY